VILDQVTTPPVTRRRRPNVLGELIIVVVLVKVYDLIRSLAAVREAPARRHGSAVLAIERALSIDWELAANRWLTARPPLEMLAVYWYQFAHISVTLAVLVWCYAARPDLYRRMRNALVITNVVGMTVYFLLPVMPPRLLPGTGYVDTVADAGFGTTHGGPVPADQYAAMPSLHLAWALWTGFVAAALVAPRLGTLGRRLCYLYPLTTAVVVVATANHFVLDVVAGVTVGAGALAVAKSLPGWLAPVTRSRAAQLVAQARFRWDFRLAGSGLGLRRSLRQMIRRRSSTASTSPLGSNGSHTVMSLYPRTAPRAAADDTPTAARPAASVTSSAPSPPGEGTTAERDDTTR
jgi:hypothetical protein